MANIRNELEYINEMARSDPAALVVRSEERYRNIVAGIAKQAVETHGHKLVLLAGPSASGKTTTAELLAKSMKAGGINAYRISLDDFYYESADIPLLPDGTPDIESVHALDLPLIRSTMRELMLCGRAGIPHFKFSTGSRSRWDSLEIGADDVIILEGLHALNPEISAHVPDSVKVYVSVSSRIYDEKRNIIFNKRGLRLVRRILRDSQFRGASAEDTVLMWPAVTLGEETWLAPCKQYADVLINSIHIYEPCVFRTRVLPLLEAIPPDSPAYMESRRAAKALRKFTPLPEEFVPSDSLLREFLG